MIKFSQVDPKKDAPRTAQPDKVAPAATPPPAPAPVIHVQPLVANQVKPSLDGKFLGMEGKGHLLDFSFTNISAGTRYLMLFDQATKPGDGERPKRVWTVTTLQSFDGVWPAGRPFNSGCSLVLSSTQSTLTNVTALDGIMEASFLIP